MSWHDVEEVLNRAELPEVARRLGLEVQLKGANILTRCPFHDDRRPSLVLYPREANSSPHFHCFSCNAHGHAVDLVKEVKGLDFKSAVAWLGDSFGIASARKQQTSEKTKKSTKEDVFTFAQRVYEESQDPAAFESWCQEREFEPSFLKGIGLRCISRGSPLVRALSFKNLGERLELIDGLCAAGLLVRLRAKPKIEMQGSLDLTEQFRDYFDDGRILIPISSANGKIIAYAGRYWKGGGIRINSDNAPAKYLQTRGFRKAEILFNYHNAAKLLSAKAAKNADSPTLYVVEGFMDALRLQSLNLPSVAVMGTSISTEQLQAIVQLANTTNIQPGGHLRVRLFFDLDTAGFDGAARAARQLLGLEGTESEWIGFADCEELPQGKDPDEILKGMPRSAAIELCNTKALPVAGLLVASSLGYKDATPLLDAEWNGISRYPRERALVQTARTLRALSNPNLNWSQRLASTRSFSQLWVNDLVKYLEHRRYANVPSEELGFLAKLEARLNHARLLAEYGARRGELPCDDEAWRALDRSAPLFNTMILHRLAADTWEQVAPADAVNLPRKLSADQKVLKDPRRKVMLHAADLHLQQLLMNELLTERHDFSHEGPRNFSDCIPAVRWFRTEREKRITGYTKNDDLNPRLKDGEGGEPILSFAYQVDMDVLEGRRKPTSQGMFRPYIECWHDFMESLSRQAHEIGSKVYVLRLDAKRYYDKIQRFVLRDQLLEQIEEAVVILGPESEAFDFLNVDKRDTSLVSQRLVDLLLDSLFGYKYRNPDDGRIQIEDDVVGIPQGPVVSAWMGTIAMFPVDGVARKFMRASRENHSNESAGLRPRAGYARYVDDIVLMADSEALLEDLRSAIVKEAARLGLTLVRKGENVEPGTPEEVRKQLNEGRILAASVPTWEPPLRGDGEAGWDIDFDDAVPMDRQCALQLLRHPMLLDDPAIGLDMVRDAMRAQNMRVNDLGRCARALWWQVAITSFSEISVYSPEEAWLILWSQYVMRWREVCRGHNWALAFEHSGYDILIAVEGLDMLLDSRMGLENGRSEQWVERHQLAISQLSAAVLSADRHLGFDPAHNKDHIYRRIDKLKWKAWNLRRHGELTRSEDPQMARGVTTINWLCLAACLLNRYVGDHAAVDLHTLEPMRRLPVKGSAPEQIRELHDFFVRENGDSTSYSAESKNLALQFLVANSSKESRAKILSQYPELLCPQDANLTILPLLPLEGARLLAFSCQNDQAGIPQETEILAFRYSQDDLPLEQAFGAKLVHALAEKADPIVFDWNKKAPERLAQSLWRFQARLPIMLCFNQVSTTSRAHFAAGLYRVLFEIVQRSHKELTSEKALVPVWSHMAHSPIEVNAHVDKPTVWYLIAEPVDRLHLGVMTFIRDGHGGIRSVNVPGGEYSDLWRLGCAVSDALNIPIDLEVDIAAGNQVGTTDEGMLGDSVVQVSQVEEYLLNQQLRKLRGTWIADAQVRDRREGALPRTVERALRILEKFDSDSPENKKVLQVMYVEAETQSMAMRLKRPGRGDLRGQLHALPFEVLRRIPLRVLEHLQLPGATNEKLLRTDLAALLALADVLRVEQDALKANAALSGVAEEPALALCLGVALATIGTALRGLVASAWGITRLSNKSKLPTYLTIPPTWSAPEDGRLDPQSDYDQIRDWAHMDDWGKFSDATPWQFMLLLLGMLDYLAPDVLDDSNDNLLKQVYEHLRLWQSAPPDSENSWAWPFDEMPQFDLAAWWNILRVLPDMVRHVDELLGVVIEQVEAPSFKRDRNGNYFTDSNGQRWALKLIQFSGLGRADSVARIQRPNSSALLPTWTEVRRRADRELLSVHTLDDKLGKWIYSASLPVNSESGVASTESTSSNLIVPVVLQSGDYSQDSSTEKEAAPKEKGFERKGNSSTDGDELGMAGFRRTFKDVQQSEWGARLASKSDSHLRVALFQYCVEESYSHPLAEVGLKGLRMPLWAQNELRKVLKSDSKWSKIDKAAKRGSESSWVMLDKVLSWPEHRRRKLLMRALEACHRLGVDLLLLPEYSVRPSTIDWLSGELRNRFKGLAVLAGTYRFFGESFERRPVGLKTLSTLMAPLTLLWSPKESLSKKLFQHNEAKTVWLERGKKYRAVAANELFNPDWQIIAPLFRADPVLKQLQDIGREGDSSSLLNFVAEEMPPLRYCMELICSELFLLTSPANYEPLRNEVASLIRRFGGGSDESAEKMVKKDFISLGNYLTVLQGLGAPRRSVLLVPAMSTRSNDYWHAGQASVLASGTATVFCNATNTDFGAGGSCFIGIDSVTNSHTALPGFIETLTPYHGWGKGILSSRADGALSKSDQALVVADIDPVHVVSGKPRPQLLPIPMALVAYLPVVELLDSDKNKNHVYREIFRELKNGNDKDMALRSLATIASGDVCLKTTVPKKFWALLEALQKTEKISREDAELESFTKLFGDSKAVFERLDAWARDRVQQPYSPKRNLRDQPAWLDILPVDLTLQEGEELPFISVPPWIDSSESS